MTTETKSWDELAFIMDYESGELDEDDVIAGFQHLVDTLAAALIHAGLVQA